MLTSDNFQLASYSTNAVLISVSLLGNSAVLGVASNHEFPLEHPPEHTTSASTITIYFSVRLKYSTARHPQ